MEESFEFDCRRGEDIEWWGWSSGHGQLMWERDV